MTERNTKLVTLLMVAGAVVGAVCGYFLPHFSLAVGFLGRWFVGALTILIIPALAAGAITGVTSFGELRRVSGVLKTLLLYFAATTVIAVVLAAVVGRFMAPAAQLGNLGGAPGGPVVSAWQSLSNSLGGLIPGNLFQAAVEGKYIGFVLLTVLLGGVLASIGLHGRTIVTFFRGLSEALHRVVGYVLYAAPLGVFSLVAVAVAGNAEKQANWAVLTGPYITASLICLAVYGLIILPLAVRLFAGRPVLAFFSDLSPAFLTALGTGSKTVTFPVTMRCLTDRSRMDLRSVATALPISTVLGFDGSMILPVIATVIAASAFGISLGIGQILMIVLLAAVASVGTAGLPLASLLAAPAMFGLVGMSLEQSAFAMTALTSVGWLLDRVRAMVNTGSDAVACALVAGAAETRGPAARPARGRRPERLERDSEESGRERFGGRSEGFGDSRRRSGTPAGRTPRGRREESGGRFGAGASGARPRPDTADRSPFQMKAGRTPALGVDAEKPTPSVDRPPKETERPPRETERFNREAERPAREVDRFNRDTERTSRDRDERREPRRSGSGFGDSRGSRGRHRSGAERSSEPAGRRPAEEPAEETATPKIESPRISPDVVARDLSRVSAQLREPQPDESRDADVIERPRAIDQDAAIGSEEEAVSLGRRDVDDELPEFDGDLSDSQENAFDGNRSDEEPQQRFDAGEERPDADITETSAAPDASFGRGRHFRGANFRKSDSAESDAPKSDIPAEPTEEAGSHGFSSEDASFGRIKRKRTR